MPPVQNPPWSLRLIAELDAADARAIAVARGLDAGQLNWTPRPGAWGVGQCLDHLCVASDVYLPAIAQALTDDHAGVVEEITPGWLAQWFIRNYIEPSADTRRARAPRKIAPAAAVDAAVLDRFLRNNEEARRVIARASAYDVNRLRFRNPFIPLLRFTVGSGFEILSRHERRHLLQAEAVRAAPGFPAAGPT
jgi:hypothetical protein